MKRIILAALVGVLVGGCDDLFKSDVEHIAEKLERIAKTDPLAAIAPGIFFMENDAAVGKVVACLISESLGAEKAKEKDSPPAQKKDAQMDALISAMFATQRKVCEFWKSVEQATKPVHARITREKSIPEGLHFFSVFESSDDVNDEDLYKKVDVGVFENIDTCQRLNAQYQEFGEGTAPCKKFEPLLPHLEKRPSPPLRK